MSKPLTVELAKLGRVSTHAAQAAETAFPLLIPLDACPPELALLGQGRTVGLRVIGSLTPAGVRVERVDLIR